MKRLIYFLGIIVLLGLVSASPLLYFIDPTPINNYETTSDNFEINVSITNVSNSSEIIFYWEGTNYTLYDNSTVLMLNLNNNSDLGENDSVVVDVSNYSHNGSVTSATFTTSGKYGGAYSFDADSEYVTFSDSQDFRSENFSISLWANLEDMSVKQVSALGQSTCVLLDRGDVYCVGLNSQGQLGIGSTTDQSKPQLVSGGYNFSVLDNAGYPDSVHMCGILVNGSAICWGRNAEGQLGDNSTTQRTSPVAVNGSYNFTQISVGRYHTCGILINGTALCWGRNDKGQLGDNTTIAHNIPGPLVGDYNFSMISSGDDSTCGILVNGSGMCWGRAEYGALGDGQSSSNKIVPTNISGDYNFTYITNGNQVACGILVNGSAVCWGGNKIGSFLGNGVQASSNVPVGVSGDYNFTYLEQGYASVCGILVNGSVKCWGRNNQAALGDGTKTSRLSPVDVSGNYNFSGLSIGYGFVCGLLTNGSLACWGENSYGQLGKSTGSSSSYTSPILFLHGDVSSSSYASFAFGDFHGCGLLYDGNVTCWGDGNLYGQIGDNETSTRTLPTLVSGDYNFSELYAGFYHSCGLLQNGSAVCWGNNVYGQIGNGATGTNVSIPTPVSGDYNFSSLALGNFHSCGLLVNGSVLCWGRDHRDQLGCDNCGDQNSPVAINGSYNFTFISSGANHVCGILVNDSSMCWGQGTLGQLGYGGTSNQAVPVNISGDYNFSSLYGGGFHTCGIISNGSALCWGQNSNGEVGDNSTTQRNNPTSVYGNYNFSDLSLGFYFVCGLLTNGSLACWGDNGNSQVGNGLTTDILVPYFLDIGQEFSAIYSGSYYNFGVLTDGRVISWGINNHNQHAFSAFDQLVPTKGFYKGNIFGKGTESFKLGSTFGGGLFSYTGYGFKDIALSSGWNHVVLTYDGSTAKVYINGSLEDSFTPPVFSWPNDTANLILGEDIRGSVDEAIMWNRTLSASEVTQVYESNLKKVNSTDWEFYSNKSSLSVGSYTYGLFFEDLLGDTFTSGLRNFIVNAASSSSSSSSSDTSGSGGVALNYNPTSEQISEGYSKLLKEGDSVSISSYSVGVESVGESVVVSVLDTDYTLSLYDTIKIDSDDDGYYDLSITVEEIRSNGYSSLQFKEIYEEIPSEQKDSSGDESKTNGEDFDGSNNTWIYVLVIVVLVLVIVYSIFGKKIKKLLK